MLKKFARIAALNTAFFGLVTSSAHAQVSAISSDAAPFTDLGKLIGNVLAVIFFVAGLATFLYLLIGGLQWITSGGDVKAATAARDRITAALVGLIIIIAAVAVTLILERVFGIRILSGVTFPNATNTVLD